MAKNTKKSKKPATTDNGSTQPSDGDANTTRQIIVHTQYIKDLSFENPNAPRVLIEGAGSLMLKSPSMLAPSFLATINMR